VKRECKTLFSQGVLNMSCLGNGIWLVFGGFISGMGYIIGGLLTCLTIIGIPFGLQTIKLGVATLTPFGREIYTTPQSGGCLQTAFNVGYLFRLGDCALSPASRWAAGNHHRRDSLCYAAFQTCAAGVVPLWEGIAIGRDAITPSPFSSGRGSPSV
jgi:hypothetical protein